MCVCVWQTWQPAPSSTCSVPLFLLIFVMHPQHALHIGHCIHALAHTTDPDSHTAFLLFSLINWINFILTLLTLAYISLLCCGLRAGRNNHPGDQCSCSKRTSLDNVIWPSFLYLLQSLGIHSWHSYCALSIIWMSVMHGIQCWMGPNTKFSSLITF